MSAKRVGKVATLPGTRHGRLLLLAKQSGVDAVKTECVLGHPGFVV